MRGFIGSLRPGLGRIAGIVVSLIVVAGFAFVLLQIAAGGPAARTTVGDDPTATAPLIQYETPTPTPLDAPPTATHYVPGNATATPLPRDIPFSVDDAGHVSLTCVNCNTAVEGITNDQYWCSTQLPFWGQTALHVTNGAPGGVATYRWISDLGPVSPVITRTLKPGDGDGSSNFIYDTWTMSATLGNGVNHWVQLEVLTPNHLTTPEAWFNIRCDFKLHDVTPAWPNASFDCSGPDAQTFSFTAQASVEPGPPGHSITYHWERYDGSKSPSYTVAVPGGVTTFDVQGDSITLTRPLANSSATAAYWDKLVVDSPAPDNQSSAITVSVNC